MIPEYRVVFHPEAQRELAELYDYIAEQAGPVIAWDFISGIRTFCLELHTFPKRGTERTELREGLRIIGYGSRVSIAFQVNDDRVMILGVFYGGRQITTDMAIGNNLLFQKDKAGTRNTSRLYHSLNQSLSLQLQTMEKT
ncbi:type II toxin-antitoxin system RelE/ParE family toxin [Rhizobium sp. GCM10022189]|uniref:type II toxin-antitoxin system RelE/ParE family toxin n=1 Tax=Rhizobium sp. GCM10022189 TaxID=3252654 RepID=UPI003605CCD1